MANDKLAAQLVVPFGDDVGGNSLLWERDPRRDPPEFFQEYVRLYPQNVPTYFATSGYLGKLSDQTELLDDVVVFNGSTETSLRYPETLVLSIYKLGKFYDMDGNPADPVFEFDASRNLITSSIEGYGALAIKQQIKYTLFLYTFAGGPCPGSLGAGYFTPTAQVFGQVLPAYSSPPGFSITSYGSVGTDINPDDAEPRSPFDEALLVAIDQDRGATATMRMSPPTCQRKEFHVHKGDEADLPSAALIIDPNYPIGIRFLLTEEADNTIPLSATCGIRLIPADGDYVVRCNLPDAFLGKEESNSGYEQVAESLQFSGSSSVNLQYQAYGSVAVTERGTYRNKWGSTISVSFATSGDTVYEVERESERSFRNPRSRKVGADEIVAVDSWNRTIEVFGVVDVSYNYSYDFYRLRIPYYAGSGKFRNAFVTAVNEDDPLNFEAASLFVEPPSLEGLW